MSCSTRVSAETGSATISMSTGVRRQKAISACRLPRLAWPAIVRLAALDAAVVEYPADADVAVRIGGERLQQALAGWAGAVHDGTPRQLALCQAAPRQRRDDAAVGHESNRTAHEPQGKPGAGEVRRNLEEEHAREQQAHRRGPAQQQAGHLAMSRRQRRHVVEPEALEHRDGGEPGERQGCRVLAEEVRDVEIRDQEADAGDESELGHAHQAREDARRHLAARADVGELCHGGTGIDRRPRGRDSRACSRCANGALASDSAVRWRACVRRDSRRALLPAAYR